MHLHHIALALVAGAAFLWPHHAQAQELSTPDLDMLLGPPNDAGSGRDAPTEFTDEVVVYPGTEYRGRVGTGSFTGGLDEPLWGQDEWDRADVFAFDAQEGDWLQLVLAQDLVGCPDVFDSAGEEVASSCSITRASAAIIDVELPSSGRYFLRVQNLVDAETYQFAFTLTEQRQTDAVDLLDLIFTPTGGQTAPPPLNPGDPNGPFVVIAVVDTGINPYHQFYQAPELWQNEPPTEGPEQEDVEPEPPHPGRHIDGFPLSAQMVNLSLDAPSFASALEADRETWNGLSRMVWDQEADGFQGPIYTFPGTRVIAGVSFGEYTDLVGSQLEDTGTQYPILADHSHGQHSAGLAGGMTLNRADANVLLVAVEVGSGTFDEGIRWAARQPWIDAISVSLGSRANLPGVDSLTGEGIDQITREAAESGKPVLIASGNGISNTGLTSDRCTTYTSSYTGPTWVTRVGAAHPQTGNPSSWHCLPVEVIAATPVYSASAFSKTDVSSAGGTSAATPNVMGHYAHLLLDARRAGLPLTRLEVLDVLLKSAAYADPAFGAASHPSAPGAETLDQGYGLIDQNALDRAREHLQSETLPQRPDTESWFAVDHYIRNALWGADGLMSGGLVANVQAPEFMRNDAGSGRDAPGIESFAAAPVYIEVGVSYDGWIEGMGYGDESDTFEFWGEAGDVQRFQMSSPGGISCMRVDAPSTAILYDGCADDITVELEESGWHRFEIRYFHPFPYRLRIGGESELGPMEWVNAVPTSFVAEQQADMAAARGQRGTTSETSPVGTASPATDDVIEPRESGAGAFGVWLMGVLLGLGAYRRRDGLCRSMCRR